MTDDPATAPTWHLAQVNVADLRAPLDSCAAASTIRADDEWMCPTG